MSICFIIGLLPASAFAADSDHSHSWESTWTASDSHHWHKCTSDGCAITSEAECKGYGAHDFSTYPYRCTVCHFGTAHEHYGGTATCEYNATCKGCGTVYGETDPNNHQIPEGFAERIDSTSHKIMCSCGHIFVASEPHSFTPWDKNKDGTEERWCEDCLYAETRTSQHTHSYSEATCSAPATCSCGSTTGTKNPQNHTGGTELKNTLAATHSTEGYSGDTYCKGCGAMLEKGKSVSRLSAFRVELGNDADAEQIVFQPADGISIPSDATFSAEVLSNHHGVTQLRDALSSQQTTLQIINTDAMIQHLADTAYQQPSGDTYRTGEVILIDNEKYCIAGHGKSGTDLSVVGLSDGIIRSFDTERSLFTSENEGQCSIDSTPNRKLCQDDVIYDIALSYADPQGNDRMVLSYDGQLAGVYDKDGLHLYDGYDPETLKTDSQGYVGTFRLSEGFTDNGLKADTDYRVELLSARDVQLLSKDGAPLTINDDGSLKEIGTLALELYITAPTDAVTLGIHLGDNGIVDFGTVMPVDGSSHSLITFQIGHFSPFLVCTFTEADAPELISITSNTSDTGSVDDTDGPESVDKKVWIWLSSAVLFVGGVTFAAVTCIRKRRK